MKNPACSKHRKKNSFKEWVLYDGECSLCSGYARQFIRTLNNRGIGLAPVQSDFAQEKTKRISDPLKEMLLVTDDGKVIGGADALIYLSRKIWWAYGFFLMAKVPGVRSLYRMIYDHVARNRHRR